MKNILFFEAEPENILRVIEAIMIYIFLWLSLYIISKT